VKLITQDTEALMSEVVYLPVDLYGTDVVATEVAFRMVTNKQTWPGPMLAMKRLAMIQTPEGLYRIDPVEFGRIWHAEEPVVIELRNKGGVAVYETVKDMLKDGWTVD
jgi:hypothetical protein